MPGIGRAVALDSSLFSRHCAVTSQEQQPVLTRPTSRKGTAQKAELGCNSATSFSRRAAEFSKAVAYQQGPKALAFGIPLRNEQHVCNRTVQVLLAIQ